MDIIITELSPETLDALRELAQKSGKTLEEYTRALLERETNGTSRINLSPEQKAEQWREWASSHNANTPILSDEAISRENIYEERG